jgi:hypothetical protein
MNGLHPALGLQPAPIAPTPISQKQHTPRTFLAHSFASSSVVIQKRRLDEFRRISFAFRRKAP